LGHFRLLYLFIHSPRPRINSNGHSLTRMRKLPQKILKNVGWGIKGKNLIETNYDFYIFGAYGNLVYPFTIQVTGIIIIRGLHFGYPVSCILYSVSFWPAGETEFMQTAGDAAPKTYPFLRGTQLMAGFIDFPFDFTHSFLWFACESKCSRAQLESRSVMVDCAIGSLLFALFVLEKPPKAPKKHTPHCFLCVGSQWATWFALFAILGFYAALIKCVFGWIVRDGIRMGMVLLCLPFDIVFI